MENILKILKRREANIQYHGSWDERENEVLLVENYTSTRLEPGIFAFPQKTWEIHISTTFAVLHFWELHFEFWPTWNQLSWNLFLPADFVRLEQRTEEPFLLFDLKKKNVNKQTKQIAQKRTKSANLIFGLLQKIYKQNLKM